MSVLDVLWLVAVVLTLTLSGVVFLAQAQRIYLESEQRRRGYGERPETGTIAFYVAFGLLAIMLALAAPWTPIAASTVSSVVRLVVAVVSWVLLLRYVVIYFAGVAAREP